MEWTASFGAADETVFACGEVSKKVYKKTFPDSVKFEKLNAFIPDRKFLHKDTEVKRDLWLQYDQPH